MQSQIVKYGKQLLVIGNVNAITYKEIFDLIQHDKAWLGVNLGRGISGFIVPDYYAHYGTEVSINDQGQTIIATNGCLCQVYQQRKLYLLCHLICHSVNVRVLSMIIYNLLNFTIGRPRYVEQLYPFAFAQSIIWLRYSSG